MRYITLLCSAGMSTSMLMSRMKESAGRQGIEVSIVAMPDARFNSYTGVTDVLLLGPQVNHLLDAMKALYEPKGMKVAGINTADYGMMDGEKVLRDALALLD